MRTTRVNIIYPNGDVQKGVYTFVNDKSERYNLLTLYMMLHHNSHYMDESQRSRYEGKIQTGKSGKNVFFETADNKVYIARINDTEK